MKNRNQGLDDHDRGRAVADEAEHSDADQERAFSKVQRVQGREERLVSKTHDEQNRSRGVIHLHYRVLAQVDHLVAGFPLEQRGVQVYPVTRDVDSHTQLKEEHVLGVEVTESDEQTHCAASIGQLVQDSSELGALVEIASGVSVDGVQETGHAVADDRHEPACRHEVKGDEREYHSGVPDNVGNKQKYVL